MKYYEPSDLSADNATPQHIAYGCYNSGTGRTRSPEDSRSRQHDEPLTTALARTTSDNSNNMNGGQRKNIGKDAVKYLGNNYQDPFAPYNQARFPQLASLQQRLIFPNPTQNAALPHNIGPFRIPVETATRRRIGRPIIGVSLNYLGDPYLPANQSANIPDELNTSVWITNLPENVNHKTLLDSVRNCGKVYAAVINGPEHGHITAASKIVFFDVAGAQNLLEQARKGIFTINGHPPRVILNRIKTEAKTPSPNSRVLHIEGPSCIVNREHLADLFLGDGITWQDEEVIVLSNNGLLTRLEWRFGSYRCQAESARHLIDRTKRYYNSIMPGNIWQGVTVHFGVDPCAPTTGKFPLSRFVFRKMLEEANQRFISCAAFTYLPPSRKP
ncbi:hypothetical protein F4803DRAFT_570066, partial [Xylaria telfairii]